MWFILAMAGVLAWGLSDMLYKMGTRKEDPHSFMKIGIWVGIVMGGISFLLLPFSESRLPLGQLLISSKGALLSSFFYIISMLVGYAGLRYLELSITSPVQNASGAVAMIGMLLFFLAAGKFESLKEAMTPLQMAGVVFSVVGMIALAVVEKKISHRERELVGAGNASEEDRKYRVGVFALLFPLGYCILDSIGTAVNGIALDSEVGESLGEIDNQIIYGIFWLCMGICMWICLWIREGSIYNPFRKSEKIRFFAGCTETAGNILYIYAMAANPVLTAPVIASYCIVSMILSRFILKEKLCSSQYVCLGLITTGIVIMGIAEGIQA